jgi:hypothetical protein
MARAGGARAVKRNLSPWSKRRFSDIDGRLVEAREERQIITELTAHVGGRPTAPQRLLIQRLARGIVIVAMIERKIIESQDLGDLQARQLNALWNSIRLGLDKLGLEPAEAPTSLAAYVGGKAA